MQKQPAATRPSASNTSYPQGLKTPFEEKFVRLYKDIFSGQSPIHSRKDTGIHGHAASTRFWDELLLLKVNEGFLIKCISNCSEEQLTTDLKLVLNELFATCSLYLEDGNFIRVAHALETLIILFQEIFKKKFTEQGFIIITLIAGLVDNADSFFLRLISRVADLLKRDDVPILVKSLCLRLYFTILTTTDNLNTNIIASYFFQVNVVDAILATLTVKLSEDRRSLELDATLVFILLLLWRESENIYAGFLSSTSAPLVPLLQTAHSLLSFSENLGEKSLSNSSLSPWFLTEGVVSLFGNLLGFGSRSQTLDINEKISSVEAYPSSSVTGVNSREEFSLHTTAGIILTYFLVYFSPLMKSDQLWPSSNSVPLKDSGNSVVQSISSLWIKVLQAFISMCGKSFRQLSKAEAGVLRTKCCLNVLRCLLEAKVSLQYLAFCDVDNFTLRPAFNVIAGIPYIIPFKSALCVVLDHASEILNATPGTYLEPDLFYRAAVLVPLIFNCLKLQGWQFSAQSIEWLRLWKGLIGICQWAGDKSNFERPGVPELAELILGILESCLGNSQDICSVSEESERLHALIMAHMDSLNNLAKTAASMPFGGAKTSTGGPVHLVNISAVKLHYEIPIAALGIRGRLTYEQALQGVKKKGMANLKLKPRHAGPTRSYAEGTAELRLLINIARWLVSVHRRQTFTRPPKLDVSTFEPQSS